VRVLRPALIALLAAAIVLLGLSSMPREAFSEPRLNNLLVRHRLEIAVLGTVAFVAVLVAFLIS
jgi:hypothetical protein